LALLLLLLSLFGVTRTGIRSAASIGCAFKAKALCAAVLSRDVTPRWSPGRTSASARSLNYSGRKSTVRKKCNLLSSGNRPVRKKSDLCRSTGLRASFRVDEETIRGWKPGFRPLNPPIRRPFPGPMGDRLAVGPPPSNYRPGKNQISR